MTSFNSPLKSRFEPGTAGFAKIEVELSISARNLLDLDIFSKSDPMCVVYTRDDSRAGQNWNEIGRTECIDNNLNPEFATKIQIQYLFEQRQFLKFEVYDIDSDSQQLQDHDFIGSAESTIGQIVSGGSNGLVLLLKNNDRPNQFCGELLLKSEEVKECRDVIELQIGAKMGPRNETTGISLISTLFIIAFSIILFFSTYLGVILLSISFGVWLISKPSGVFLTISKASGSFDKYKNQSFNVVHRTEINYDPVKPTWKSINLPIKTLCNSDAQRLIKIECYQCRRNGNHLHIGEIITTTQALLEKINDISNKHSYEYKLSSSCVLEIIHCDIKSSHTFLDYVQGGTELACTVSIDFTASNGDPYHPDSLHYIQENGKISI